MGPTPASAGQREQATSETAPTHGGSILVLTFSLPWEFDGGVAKHTGRDRLSSSCGGSDFAPQASSAVLGLSQPAQDQG
jgi:hypothetical protein